ncbi:UDP-N-acetylmuramoyl-L-alanine--D-glutamate ligase [Mucisphaera sp.]|uniref:UDP-N-acetylmuramoyl-L-alanine--D-glutamate ligase n=1 Tax=Mucisphaera sp. TaxID=2913024 RepID=UPI003D1253E2
MTELRGKRITVMGLGRFGGGTGVTRFLIQQGARVLLTDQQPAEQLTDSLRQIADLTQTGALTLRLGEHREEDFTDTDLVVVSPAVHPATNPYTQAAAAADIPLTSEIRLLIERLPTRRVIGVTGTAGKSTTASMIHHALTHLAKDRVWLGGNLGGSLLNQLPEIQPTDAVVLELSSFMLDGLRADRWSPHISVVTNLHPNHLDWHGSFQHYANSKQQILEHQTARDHAILGPSCTPHLQPRTTQLAWLDSVDVIDHPLPPLRILGKHNRDNARLAIEAIGRLGYDRTQAAQALADFQSLPHRLCLIAESQGVQFIDDSKSTTPEAAILAIDAILTDRPDTGLHLILGGYDKAIDLAILAQAASQRCKAVYTIGQTAPALMALQTGPAIWHQADTIDNALAKATQTATPGDALLLSPGCASWDQFTNYEQRGQAFAQAIQTLTNPRSA